MTNNPLIESCFSRTPPRPEILEIWLEIGRGSACLGWKLWELAGSWLRAITTMNPEYLVHLSIFEKGLGGYLGGLKVSGRYLTQSGEVARGGGYSSWS